MIDRYDRLYVQFATLNFYGESRAMPEAFSIVLCWSNSHTGWRLAERTARLIPGKSPEPGLHSHDGLCGIVTGRNFVSPKTAPASMATTRTGYSRQANFEFGKFVRTQSELKFLEGIPQAIWMVNQACLRDGAK